MDDNEKNITSLYSRLGGNKVDFSKINYENIKHYSIIAYDFLYAYCEYCVDHHMT